MYCWKCGKKIRDDAVFCTYCGADQENDSLVSEPLDYHPGILVDPSQDQTSSQEKLEPTPSKKSDNHSEVMEEPTQGTTSSQEKQELVTEEDKKDWWKYLLWGIAAIVFSFLNMKWIKSGESYFTLLGLFPYHYITLPIGVFLIIVGIKALSKNKKS